MHELPLPIREIQTDNGTEWTNALLVKKSTHKTLFEEYLEENDIIYHRIQVATPRHNGKVERQHRLDEQRFYSKMRMYNLADGRKQLAKYNKFSNNIPKCCLKYRSPNEVLDDYLGVMWAPPTLDVSRRLRLLQTSKVLLNVVFIIFFWEKCNLSLTTVQKWGNSKNFISWQFSFVVLYWYKLILWNIGGCYGY